MREGETTSLPKWNPRWDPPDPLKGRRGWTAQRYITIAAAVPLGGGFACLFLGIWLTAAGRAGTERERFERANRVHEELMFGRVGREAGGDEP